MTTVKEADSTKSQNLDRNTSPFISMITGEKKTKVESDAIYDTDTDKANARQDMEGA